MEQDKTKDEAKKVTLTSQFGVLHTLEVTATERRETNFSLPIMTKGHDVGLQIFHGEVTKPNILFPLTDTADYTCNCGRPSEMCDCGDFDDKD